MDGPNTTPSYPLPSDVSKIDVQGGLYIANIQIFSLNPEEMLHGYSTIKTTVMDALHETYKANTGIKGIYGSPFTVNEISIPLKMIFARCSPTAALSDQDNTFQLQHLFFSVDRLQKEKLVSDTDVPSHEDTASAPRHILIEGVPGVGKTTLLQLIQYRWAVRKLWQEYDWVWTLSLGELLKETECRLADLIYATHRLKLTKISLEAFRLFWEKIVVEGGKMLFIIEDFDRLECTTRLLKRIIQQQLVPNKNYSVMLITRPCDTSDVLSPDRRHLKLIGFTHDAVYRYVERYFNFESLPSDACQIFLNQMQHQLTLGAINVPLMLHLFCGAFCCEFHNTNDIEAVKNYFNQLVNQSLVYENVVKKIIYRAIEQTQDPSLKENFQTDENYMATEKRMCFLYALAFVLLDEDEENLNYQYVEFVGRAQGLGENTVQQFIREFKLIGILRNVDAADGTVWEKLRLAFPHQTFKEYFAARHLVAAERNRDNESTDNKLEEDTRNFIHKKLYSVRFSNLFSFVIGLLRGHDIDAKFFFGRLLEYDFHHDLTGDYHFSLLVRVIDNIQFQPQIQPVLNAVIEKIQEHMAECYQIWQSNGDSPNIKECLFIRTLVSSSQAREKILTENSSAVTIWQDLTGKDTKRALKFLHEIRFTNQFIGQTISALIREGRDDSLYDQALTALPVLGVLKDSRQLACELIQFSFREIGKIRAETSKKTEIIKYNQKIIEFIKIIATKLPTDVVVQLDLERYIHVIENRVLTDSLELELALDYINAIGFSATTEAVVAAVISLIAPENVIPSGIRVKAFTAISRLDISHCCPQFGPAIVERLEYFIENGEEGLSEAAIHAFIRVCKNLKSDAVSVIKSALSKAVSPSESSPWNALVIQYIDLLDEEEASKFTSEAVKDIMKCLSSVEELSTKAALLILAILYRFNNIVPMADCLDASEIVKIVATALQERPSERQVFQRGTGLIEAAFFCLHEILSSLDLLFYILPSIFFSDIWQANIPTEIFELLVSLLQDKDDRVVLKALICLTSVKSNALPADFSLKMQQFIEGGDGRLKQVASIVMISLFSERIDEEMVKSVTLVAIDEKNLLTQIAMGALLELPNSIKKNFISYFIDLLVFLKKQKYEKAKTLDVSDVIGVYNSYVHGEPSEPKQYPNHDAICLVFKELDYAVLEFNTKYLFLMPNSTRKYRIDEQRSFCVCKITALDSDWMRELQSYIDQQALIQLKYWWFARVFVKHRAMVIRPVQTCIQTFPAIEEKINHLRGRITANLLFRRLQLLALNYLPTFSEAEQSISVFETASEAAAIISQVAIQDKHRLKSTISSLRTLIKDRRFYRSRVSAIKSLAVLAQHNLGAEPMQLLAELQEVTLDSDFSLIGEDPEMFCRIFWSGSVSFASMLLSYCMISGMWTSPKSTGPEGVQSLLALLLFSMGSLIHFFCQFNLIGKASYQAQKMLNSLPCKSVIQQCFQQEPLPRFNDSVFLRSMIVILQLAAKENVHLSIRSAAENCEFQLDTENDAIASYKIPLPLDSVNQLIKPARACLYDPNKKNIINQWIAENQPAVLRNQPAPDGCFSFRKIIAFILTPIVAAILYRCQENSDLCWSHPHCLFKSCNDSQSLDGVAMAHISNISTPASI